MTTLYLSIYLWLYSPCGLWQLFQFLNLYTVDRAPWTGDQPVARPLTTHRTTQKQNKRTWTSMPGVRFEPTTPEFERAKTVHALDRAATVIGMTTLYKINLFRVLLQVLSWFSSVPKWSTSDTQPPLSHFYQFSIHYHPDIRWCIEYAINSVVKYAINKANRRQGTDQLLLTNI
jgi:hypothetical protein